MLSGSARISPYLTVYNLDDDLDRTASGGAVVAAVIDRLEDRSGYSEIKTMIINTFVSEKCIAPGSSGKLVFPCMIIKNQAAALPVSRNPAAESMRFYPQPHTRGNPRSVDWHDLSFPATELITGIANLYPDTDGVVRRMPLFFYSAEGYYYPSLFLAALCRYFEVDPSHIEIGSGRQITLPHARFRGKVDDITIPVDDRRQMLINFPGPLDYSFDCLSAARLLQSAEMKPENRPLVPPPGSLTLLGDITSWGGKFSAGIYDPVYPDNFILASALNTVLSENFLRSANSLENGLFYLPAVVLLIWFMHLMTGRSLKFFIIGLPVVYLVILLVIFCLHLFLFICLHILPALLLLPAGLLCTLFFLVGIRLQDREDRKPPVELPDSRMPEEARAGVDQGMQLPPISEKELKQALNAYNILIERQVETAMLLLKGRAYKEIADVLCISEQAVAQRAGKIYRKCGVNSRFALIDKVYKTSIILNQKSSENPVPPPGKG